MNSDINDAIQYDNDSRAQDNKQMIRKKSKFPLHLKLSSFIGAIALFVHVLSWLWSDFSDFFTENIASIFRTVLATLTGWLPFSLAESFLLMTPVLLLIYFVLTFKYFVKENHKIISLLFGILTFALSLYSLAVFTFLTGYSNSTLDKKLGIDADPVSAEQLYDTAVIVKTELDKLIEETEFDEENFSIMPYNITTMSNKLHDAYDVCCEKYDFLHNINTQVKPVCLSEPMSYTHITGIYTYFTCEANINIAFPDFTIPFTAAHEFAHQRGIARENEANFVAYLVCINSDDPYIRYSGYMNMLQYLTNALYSANRDMYKEFYSTMNTKTKNEYKAYSLFFNKYRESTASKVSGAVNDTYLKFQGTEGTKSYGMVVDLAVAYYSNSNTN